jgi:hypothetical protein
MIKGFPVAADEFPVLHEKRPWLKARYIPWRDLVTGYVIAPVADNSRKRPYLFEWRGGAPDADVSAADSANPNSFGDRDGSDKPLRALQCTSKKHRRDVHAFALRVGKYVRNRVFAERDWLQKQFATRATLIDVNSQSPIRFALLDDWLLVETTTKKGTTVEAYRLECGATLSIAKSAAERFIANNGKGEWRKPPSNK